MTTTDRINTLMAAVSLPDNVFRRYAYAQNMAHKLTTNETLRTAMVLFLMANTDTERSTINHDFDITIQELSDIDRVEFKHAFTQSFKNLLPLSSDLLMRVNAFEQHKKAA